MLNISKENAFWIELLFHRLQTQLHKNSHLSQNDLLHALIPEAAVLYQRYREKFKQLQDYKQLDLRHLDKQAYRVFSINTPEGPRKILSSSRLPKNLQALKKTARELQQSLNLSADDFKDINFARLLNKYHQPRVKRQRLLIDIMKLLAFEELNLSGCAVVTDADIVAFLKQNPLLKFLDVSNCPQVLGKGWINVYPKNYPQLIVSFIGTDFKAQLDYWQKGEFDKLDYTFSRPLNPAEQQAFKGFCLEKKDRLTTAVVNHFFHDKEPVQVAAALKHPLLRLTILLIYADVLRLVEWRPYQHNHRSSPLVSLGHKLNHNNDSTSSESKDDFLYKVVMWGDGMSGCGKTNLMLRIAEDSFDPMSLLSWGPDMRVIKCQVNESRVHKLQLWDPPGRDGLEMVSLEVVFVIFTMLT